MASPLKGIDIRHQGDPQGNGMVLELTTYQKRKVYAIAVPQPWDSSTGPTWVYLLDNEGLTLIDAGGVGSFQSLVQGLQQAGFSASDVERVILTHGHQDHDGATAELIAETGAQLWAHDIYAHLLPYQPRELQTSPNSAVQREMQRVIAVDMERWQQSSSSPHRDGHDTLFEEYLTSRKALRVNRSVQQGDQVGDLTFIYTPGHSPDHICISWDGVLFTGDHVLPEITPHPTTKVEYPSRIKEKLPPHYRSGKEHWGLAIYLRSLKVVQALDPGTAILPAHRLFSRGRLNLPTIDRAEEILQHHVRRLHQIVVRMGHEPSTLEDITRGIFSRRKLIGGNLYAAFREVVSHLELLVDTGDVEQVSGKAFRSKGTENFRQFVKELQS